MKTDKIILSLFFLATILSYSQKAKIITVSNPLNVDREFETIELDKQALGLKITDVLEKYGIREMGTFRFLISQCVDENGDGISDVILFQPTIKAASTKKYEVVPNSDAKSNEPIIYCYSRFVPERTDDYAWENNKVAFRTYGPTAQKMTEDKVKGGSLTSGIDAWLKRVV